MQQINVFDSACALNIPETQVTCTLILLVTGDMLSDTIFTENDVEISC